VSSAHDRRVARVADQIRALDGSSAHVAKGGVHHVVPLPGRDARFSGQRVDASELRNIIEIDATQRRCVAEPGVAFEDLVRATLRKGLLPRLVPELKGITVGGAVAGCSVESMSYRFGGFHDTCSRYELIDGRGDVVVVDRSEDALFEMIHGSYGTLGVLTEVTFQLIEAKPYVRMTYETVSSAEEFSKRLSEECDKGAHDFVDAIVHGPDRFVICLGDFVDVAPSNSDYTRTRAFYLSTREKREDYLTTFDYCFRYDTDAHWITATIPPLRWRWVRAFVGRWMLGSTNLIRWSARLSPILNMKKRPEVVSDVFIPRRRFLDFWRWYERDVAFYPLWVVPYRMPMPYPWLNPSHADRMGDDLFLDCAIYGMRNNGPVDASVVLEEKVFELNGIKALIGRNHYSEERFWEIYDRSSIEAAKKQLDPDGVFADLYPKLGRVE
jgi:FAD/FMN-containing dehydrogenase